MTADVPGDVGRELAVQGGQVIRGSQRHGRCRRRVVIDHRGHDGQVLAVVEQFHHPGLARPVHHRAGGDLPEPARRVAGVGPGADRVGVRVAVEPQDHVGEPVQQGHQPGAEQRLAVRSRVTAAAVVQRVGAVMGEHDHQPVVVAGPDLAAVRAAVGRVHLRQAGFQPAGLPRVQAPGCAAGQAVGVQRDEADRRRVVDVVGGAVQPVPFGEPVAERPRAGPQVGVDEVPPGDRPPERIGRDLRAGARP